jgi:hypothetical protein
MPAHHNLDRCLEAYIAAAIAQDRKGPLFHTTNNSLLQSDMWRMLRRWALSRVPPMHGLLSEFLRWCEGQGIAHLASVELLGRTSSRFTAFP